MVQAGLRGSRKIQCNSMNGTRGWNVCHGSRERRLGRPDSWVHAGFMGASRIHGCMPYSSGFIGACRIHGCMTDSYVHAGFIEACRIRGFTVCRGLARIRSRCCDRSIRKARNSSGDDTLLGSELGLGFGLGLGLGLARFGRRGTPRETRL